jgi:hypothetical protein
MEWSGTTGGSFESVENAPPLSKSEYEFETQFLISKKTTDPNATTTMHPAGRFFLPMIPQQAATSHMNGVGMRGRKSDGVSQFAATAAATAASSVPAAPYRILSAPQQIQKPHMEKRQATALMWEVPERAGYAAINALPTEWNTRQTIRRMDPRETQSGSQE